MKKLPYILLALYIILFIICAIHPYDRGVWRAENLPIMIVVIVLIIWHRTYKFSNMSYVLMSLWVFMHTIGGYYTFERVPFGWFNHLFGFERNMYDRVAHTIIGLYAYPIAEFVYKTGRVKSRLVAGLYGVFAIGFIAASYEIAEMVYAVTQGGNQGAAFLGSQGDPWDAQKDMLCDITGACMAFVLYMLIEHRRALTK